MLTVIGDPRSGEPMLRPLLRAGYQVVVYQQLARMADLDRLRGYDLIHALNQDIPRLEIEIRRAFQDRAD